MTIDYDKVITKNSFDTEVVSKWFNVNKFNMKICEITIPIFKNNLCLCVGKYSDFEKMLKHHYERTPDNDNPMACYSWITDPETKEKRKFLLLTEQQRNAKNFGTITHETHHFTHSVLEDIGIDYGRGGEELFAYFQGYVTELVVRALVELEKAELLKVKKK